MDVARIQAELATFAADRDWQRYHSPKNLSMALAGEAGELVSLFQWLSENESRNIDAGSLLHTRVSEEVADVFIYLLRLADMLGLDVEQIVNAKMTENATKYPVALSKGNAVKYSERGR